MTFQPAHKDTTTPPGQIVNPINLEKPLQGHIKDYQATEIEQLGDKVLELELKLLACQSSLNYWVHVATSNGWKGDN